MKLYKLLKDLSCAKAGTIFNEEVKSDGTRVLEQHRYTIPIVDIDNFDEWFEEIKEPTSDIFWKPKVGEEYFYVSTHGYVESDIWSDDFDDNRLISLGVVYRTGKECKRALVRKLAEVRLRKTSTFEPDFENGKGGWIVYYDYECETLAVCQFNNYNAGEPVRYATRGEAEKSIIKNQEDWLKYLGIKEWK